MNEWWQSLSLAQQIFYTVAIFSTVVLVLRIILGSLGGDHAGDADADTSVDAGGDAEVEVHGHVDGGIHHDSGLKFLSFQTIATFLAGFGWGGVIWLNRGFGVLVAVAAGAVIGTAMMVSMAFFMRWLMRFQDSGSLDYHNAVGKEGTVYVPVPAHRGAGGQIEVMCQGRLVYADAVTESGDALKTGSRIRVVAVEGQSTFVVEAT
jgi:hypothetical protein